jgi:hypothetical protein
MRAPIASTSQDMDHPTSTGNLWSQCTMSFTHHIHMNIHEKHALVLWKWIIKLQIVLWYQNYCVLATFKHELQGIFRSVYFSIYNEEGWVISKNNIHYLITINSTEQIISLTHKWFTIYLHHPIYITCNYKTILCSRWICLWSCLSCMRIQTILWTGNW